MTSQHDRGFQVGRVLFWMMVLLLAKVFLSIVWEYRRYFPADFESDFLGGRRYSFVGIYRQAFYVHILSSPLALLLATFLVVSGGRPARLHRWIGRIQFLLVLAVKDYGGHSEREPSAKRLTKSFKETRAISLWKKPPTCKRFMSPNLTFVAVWPERRGRRSDIPLYG